ncbi:predicted protein [Pyrenophora tritici-repentis Pt-1C-BFP]|uniref:Uncharacterized protein n=1 Tax=Pyrenophora tritici-repentis (strain Pt-1C-BFP) TaxID=426418 RepID=B2W5L0_PYRTR|nr:uncharacterized protein PTRG_04910 [Pyrenophora tritici-repentis Pt-1C-BFP]EDU47817.1 predicted protein [Pyrenophora tritici-repentis Pt-1C-BFP]
MSSQETIEDPTLYQHMLLANEFDDSIEVAEIEDNPHSIRSAIRTSESPLGCKEVSRDDEEDKGRKRGQPGHTADSAPHSKLEMVLLLVTQLDSHVTQLKERVEVTADSIEHIMKRLEELENDLTNGARKKEDPTQICQQEKGILKRVKEERDDGHQIVDSGVSET